jgi:flagellar basal body P-ring formation protein FlgA
MKGVASVAFCLSLSHAALAEELSIPVPAAVIYPGDEIASALLVDKIFSVPEPAAKNFVLTRKQIEGRAAKRMLFPGKPVPLSAIKLRDMVLQGQPTKAIVSSNGIVITTTLVPLQSAASGEVIEARNPDSGTILKALVLEDGTLKAGAE